MLRDHNRRNPHSPRSLMRTIGIHTRVASFVGAVALLIQISPAMATADDHNRPVDITFTKWGVAAPPLPAPQPPFGIFEGFFSDGLPGSFVAEVLWRQASLNGHVNGLTALYEVVDGDRSFTRAHPGRVECGGLRPARRCHPRWLANRRAGASRVSEVWRYCRDAQLRRRTRQQDVFRGNHPRRARPKGLRPPIDTD